jgi:hypothetical protein
MSFRPSALSNPQSMLLYKPQMPAGTPGQKPTTAPPPISLSVVSDEEEAKDKEEGMPMAAKVILGAVVAGALGLLVYRLVR